MPSFSSLSSSSPFRQALTEPRAWIAFRAWMIDDSIHFHFLSDREE